MTAVSDETNVRTRTPWAIIITATALTAVTVIIIWLAAVPWGPVVCPAIYPMPTYCIPEYRTGVALLATITVILVCAGTIIAAIAGGKWRRAAGIGVGLLIAAPIASYIAVAFTPGFAIISPPEAAQSRAVRDIPELAAPQTPEDHFPDSMNADPEQIEPSTLRHIGTIDGYTVFIGQREPSNVCFVAVDDAANAAISSGCASWSSAGTEPIAAIWGVAENIEILIGDPALLDPPGEPVQLSESVTAYRTS
jgi:hypothetical protein